MKAAVTVGPVPDLLLTDRLAFFILSKAVERSVGEKLEEREGGSGKRKGVYGGEDRRRKEASGPSERK